MWARGDVWGVLRRPCNADGPTKDSHKQGRRIYVCGYWVDTYIVCGCVDVWGVLRRPRNVDGPTEDSHIQGRHIYVCGYWVDIVMYVGTRTCGETYVGLAMSMVPLRIHIYGVDTNMYVGTG